MTRWRMKRSGLSGRAPKLILGSAKTRQRGWIATDIDTLDMLKRDDWERYFAPNSIKALLAEHVWEHLSPDDGLMAAQLCFRYLMPGGHIRFAVPDANHPDPVYREYCKPGGPGAGDMHKVFYDYRSATALFERSGFNVRLLEYYDEGGRFHAADWDVADGSIRRRVQSGLHDHGGELAYTSLILDARKPL